MNAIGAAHLAYPSPLLYSGFPQSCCTRYVIYFQNLFLDAEHWIVLMTL